MNRLMGIWERFPPHRLLVEVSLWSADFSRLGEEIARMDPFADLYHVDASDGHLVPGLLFFPDLIAALRPLTTKPFHVHLMVGQPIAYISEFVQAGADLLTIQVENGPLVPAALEQACSLGVVPGLALGLDSPVEVLPPYLDRVGMLLLMGTPLGVKGVEPSGLVYERVRQVRRLVDQEGYRERVKIGADGGIRQHSVPQLRAAGADLVVAGSLAFKSPRPAETFNWLWSLPPYDPQRTE